MEVTRLWSTLPLRRQVATRKRRLPASEAGLGHERIPPPWCRWVRHTRMEFIKHEDPVLARPAGSPDIAFGKTLANRGDGPRLVSFTQWDTGTLRGCHGAYDNAKEAAFRPYLPVRTGARGWGTHYPPEISRTGVDCFSSSDAPPPTTVQSLRPFQHQSLVSYLDQGKAVHCRGRPTGNTASIAIFFYITYKSPVMGSDMVAEQIHASLRCI